MGEGGIRKHQRVPYNNEDSPASYHRLLISYKV
jgi:hypothetical protein